LCWFNQTKPPYRDKKLSVSLLVFVRRFMVTDAPTPLKPSFKEASTLHQASGDHCAVISGHRQCGHGP
jgi:phosphoserine phosphatase